MAANPSEPHAPSDPDGAANAAAKPGRWRPLRLARALSMWVLVDLALVAGLVAAIAWLVSTEPGLRAIADLARRFAPVTIDASGVHGALTREFGFDRVHVVAGDT
jgi:autotransporter translocation and assembly factor TamB